MVALAGWGAGAGGGDGAGAGAGGCGLGEVEPVWKAHGSEFEPTGIVGRDGAPVGRDVAPVGRDVAPSGALALVVVDVVGRAEGPGLDVGERDVDALFGVVPPAGGGADGRAEEPVLAGGALAEMLGGVVPLAGVGLDGRGEVGALGGALVGRDDAAGADVLVAWVDGVGGALVVGAAGGDVGRVDSVGAVVAGEDGTPEGDVLIAWADDGSGAVIVAEGGAGGGEVFVARVDDVDGAAGDGAVVVGDGLAVGLVALVAVVVGDGAVGVGAAGVGEVVEAAEAGVPGLVAWEAAAGREIVRRCSSFRSQSSAAASLNTVSSFGSGSACWNMYVMCVRLTSARAARSLLVIFFASRQRSRWRMTIAVVSGSTPTNPRPRPSRSCSVGRSVGASSGKLSIRSSCWGSMWTRIAASSSRRSSLAIQCFTSPRNSTVPMPPR